MNGVLASEKLIKAREYENRKQKEIPQGQKPAFHVSAPIGWINDPNGFSLYKGEYHLFYQYHPYSTNWGPMHWGHSKTDDFIKWDQLPAAIAPDEEYDQQGCFSGSAVEHEGRHVLMYTGVQDKVLEDGTKVSRQTQCIAAGDGYNYEKLSCNPVIQSWQLPEGSSAVDFRDPKIWKEGEVFYAVVGSRHEDNSGQIALFSSKDLKEWEFVSILERCNNQYGLMWECPDFFHLDGKYVLLTSPQEMRSEGLEFHNGNGTMYLIGNYDREQQDFSRESVGSIDYGLDFYAPQTVLTEDGRRVMIGWMQSWDNHMVPQGFEWSGMMTIPRELTIKNGRLCQNPVREIENYYQNPVTYKDIIADKPLELKGIRGRELDMTIDVEAGYYGCFRINLAHSEKYSTSICYDLSKNTLTFDRNYSGLKRDVIYQRSMYVKNQDGKIRIRILMDKYSVEVFVNDGEQAMTSIIHTPIESDRIVFGGEGNVKFHVTKNDVVVN